LEKDGLLEAAIGIEPMDKGFAVLFKTILSHIRLMQGDAYL
jgi:hypothetical protein